MSVNPLDSLQGPTVSTDRGLLDQIKASATYVESDVSPAYRQRIEKIVERLRTHEIDIDAIGSIEYGGYFYLPLAKAGMGVDQKNKIYVGALGGVDDIFLEAALAHEYRDLLRHQKVWANLVQKYFLDPEKYPLKLVMSRPQVSAAFEGALQRYNAWFFQNGQDVFQELDAYLFEFAYFRQYLVDQATSCQNDLFVYQITMALQRGLEEIKKAPPEVQSDFENIRIRADAELLLDQLLPAWNSLFKNRADIQKTQTECGDYLSSYSMPAHSLRDRFIILQGDAFHLGLLKTFAHQIAPFSESVQLSRLVEKEQDKVEHLLNRQALSYDRLSGSSFSYRFRYSNDSWHMRDGSFRAQHVAEVDSDFATGVSLKAGHDFGIYFPFTSQFFLKAAPLGYVGYQTSSNNYFLGARFDVGLQYDLDVTRRWGISLLTGYSLGAQAGTADSDVVSQFRLGLEAFRF